MDAHYVINNIARCNLSNHIDYESQNKIKHRKQRTLMSFNLCTAGPFPTFVLLVPWWPLSFWCLNDLCTFEVFVFLTFCRKYQLHMEFSHCLERNAIDMKGQGHRQLFWNGRVCGNNGTIWMCAKHHHPEECPTTLWKIGFFRWYLVQFCLFCVL